MSIGGTKSVGKGMGKGGRESERWSKSACPGIGRARCISKSISKGGGESRCK